MGEWKNDEEVTVVDPGVARARWLQSWQQATAGVVILHTSKNDDDTCLYVPMDPDEHP